MAEQILHRGRAPGWAQVHGFTLKVRQGQVGKLGQVLGHRVA